MNRSVCHVCQQQFKATSGLNWHLNRIHDRSSGGIRSTRSSRGVSNHEAIAPASGRIDDNSRYEVYRLEDDSFEAEVKDLYAEISERRDEVAESVRRLSHDMKAVKRRLSEAEKTTLVVRTLSAEIVRRSETDWDVYAVMQATSKLLWALDQPNSEPKNLLELASAAIISPSALARARETVRTFLLGPTPGHNIGSWILGTPCAHQTRR